EPRVGDGRGLGRSLDHDAGVAVLGQLALDAVPRPAFDVDGAHRAPGLVAVEHRTLRVEEMDADPARLVTIARDAGPGGGRAADRAEVVAALVVLDDVARPAVALDARAPPQ